MSSQLELPMLVDDSPGTVKVGETSVGMFSGRAHVSPSPTRTSIKEANDHLQLLHHRVLELEKTVQDQAEALMKKDELMQSKLKELSDAKELEVSMMSQQYQVMYDKVRKLESTLNEREMQIEYLIEKCAAFDELAAFTPSVERLLQSMKKLTPSTRPSHSHIRQKTRVKHERRTSASHERDGHVSTSGGQNLSELRIGRSFNINSNFSMSEDETENGGI